MNTDAVTVEITYHAAVAVVWQAITDKDHMRQWFFEPMTDFEPRIGFATQFNVRCDDVDYLHIWKVTDVVPLQRIAYQWQYDGYPGDSTVTWQLTEVPDGTRLQFSHEGISTFPQDNPIFSRESTQAGWNYFLCESLKAYLDRTT